MSEYYFDTETRSLIESSIVMRAPNLIDLTELEYQLARMLNRGHTKSFIESELDKVSKIVGIDGHSNEAKR